MRPILALIFMATLSFTLCAAGCQYDDSPQVRSSYDGARGMAYGQAGPWGVGLYERTFRVRVDAPLEALITAPLDLSGERAQGPFPLVVFVHGGLVPAERYLWLMEHISSRGFVVVAPKHLGDLAFFAQGNALDVTEAMFEANAREGDAFYGLLSTQPGLILGHSLGGVVAASAWLDAPRRFRHLALLASEPNPSDDFSARQPVGDAPARVLSVVGSIDGAQTPKDAFDGAQQLINDGQRVTLAVIKDVNHYQWTSDYTASELEGDGEPVLSDQEARQRSVLLLDMLLDELVLGSTTLLDQPSLWGSAVVPYEAYCAQGGQGC